MFRLIIDRNNLSLTDRLQHRPLDPAQPLAALAAISSLRPKVLFVSDPRLTPKTLADLLPRLPVLPEQIFLFGRFLQAHHAGIAVLTAMLADIGYGPGYGFDPNVCRGFGLGLLPEPATTGQAPALASLSPKNQQRGF